MTRKHFVLIAAFVLVVTAAWVWLMKSSVQHEGTRSIASVPPSKHITSEPAETPETTDDMKTTGTEDNGPQPQSEPWQAAVEASLWAQGKKSISDIKIDHLGSEIRKIDGNALKVNFLRITLVGHEGQLTKFNALVDASNGKILQTWNRPVYDSLNVRADFKLRVDPRYHRE